VKLFEVIEALVEERGLDKEILTTIVCEGMLAAFQKRYPDVMLYVRFDKKSGELVTEVEKEVVAQVADEETQISLRKAKAIHRDAEIGERALFPFDGTIGRIEIMRAKQVIAQKIKEIEASDVYNEFKKKEGCILQGVVHKVEQNGILVKIQEYLAFLPRSLSVPGEKYSAGFPIRALLKEVLEQPRSENQLILDRASAEFVEKLFSLEIPEVFEKLVEIRKIVRIAGYKTKVAVTSNDSNIDPVGTCVGVGGVRIKPILKELGIEKIDIIAWTDNQESLIKNALKPAQINRVELSANDRVARVWLDDDQRSLAIGKMGQNITLASQLSSVQIELVQLHTEDLDKKLSAEF
jgi:N utilization substance protein A